MKGKSTTREKAIALTLRCCQPRWAGPQGQWATQRKPGEDGEHVAAVMLAETQPQSTQAFYVR